MIALLALLAPAWADDDDGIRLRDHAGSAWTIGAGRATVALFGPARFGLGSETEIVTTGLPTLVAPRAEVVRRVARGFGWSVAVRGGVGVPTLGLALLRGTVLSSDPNQKVGLAAVLRAGAVGSVRVDSELTLSLHLDGRVGLTGSSFTLEPPDVGFLDPMLAPLTDGPTVRPSLVMEWVPHDTGRAGSAGVTLETALQLGGGGPDWLVRLFGQVAISRHLALGTGFALSSERARYGKDVFVAPLIDLRARW